MFIRCVLEDLMGKEHFQYLNVDDGILLKNKWKCMDWLWVKPLG